MRGAFREAVPVSSQPGKADLRQAFCDIGCTCFHVPLNWFREIFLRRQLWDGEFVGYVGYSNGEPVATAATVIAADAVGVYLAFGISKLADRGSTICTWFTERDSTRNTFARQSIPMTWDYAEANPFGPSRC